MTTPTFLLLIDMEQLIDIVKKLVAAEEVVVLEVRGDGTNSPLKVVIDSELPVSLELVTRVTKTIQNAEEMEQLFPNGFRLEVTSPGVDAPLQLPFQYRKNVNRKLSVRYADAEMEMEIAGKLTSVSEGGININLPKQGDTFIPFEKIIQAKTLVSF